LQIRRNRVAADWVRPILILSKIGSLKMSLNIIRLSSFATGKTPRHRVEAPEEISFSTGESALGAVLIARSTDGVCAILLGANVGKLKADLAARFPKNRLICNDAKLHDDLQKILHYIEMPADRLDLTLDIRGTPFERRVWEALLTIPAGKTITYAALAARIGEPKSARAVANACAANAIALAIPCHRVVRNDGTLSGYRWGVERKRALIANEA
jgi:AraC family transcriptional regulator of adaptative response/methylated-DNA-[protein]-cysteine methyltransferase